MWHKTAPATSPQCVSSDLFVSSAQGPGLQSLRTSPEPLSQCHIRSARRFCHRAFRCEFDNVKRIQLLKTKLHFLQHTRIFSLASPPSKMAPPKSSRNGQDDTKPETPHSKEKNGTSGTHQSNGKMRRVASSAGSNLREATTNAANNASGNAGATASASTLNGASQETSVPGVCEVVPFLRAS